MVKNTLESDIYTLLCLPAEQWKPAQVRRLLRRAAAALDAGQEVHYHAQLALAHVSPEAVDPEAIKVHPAGRCYVNTNLRKSLVSYRRRASITKDSPAKWQLVSRLMRRALTEPSMASMILQAVPTAADKADQETQK